jgi:hypothetical protein
MGHVALQLVEALRHSLKVVGSISDRIIEIFHWPNPSGRTMALWSTQLLT